MSEKRALRLRFLQRLFISITALSLIIPGIYMLRTLVLGLPWYWAEENTLLYNIIFTFTVSAAIFAANISTVRRLDKTMPWSNYVVRRILFEFLITSLNAAFIMLVWTYWILNIK